MATCAVGFDFDHTLGFDNHLERVAFGRLAAQFGALGQPTAFTPAGKEIVESNTAYIYRVAFATTTLDEIFVLDGSGLISGLRFTPAQ